MEDNLSKSVQPRATASAKEKILGTVLGGDCRPGQRLPAFREFARDFGLTRNAVAGAVKELVDEGWLVSRRGSGTYVSPRVQEKEAASASHEYCMVLTTEPTIDVPEHAALTRRGIQQATGTNVIHMITLAPSCDYEDLRRVVRRLSQPGSRYAFALVSVPVQIKRFFQNHKIPAVALGACEPGIELPSVRPDFDQNMRDAVGLLLETGHKRIAFICHTPHRGGDYIFINARTRMLAKHGLGRVAEDPRLIVSHVEEEGVTRHAVEQLLRAPDRPTAFVTIGDLQAVWVIKAARRLGLRVPEEIAVISLDDSELCRQHRPPITAVNVSYFKWGVEASNLMARMLRGESVGSEEVIIPHKIELRGTTSAPGRLETTGQAVAVTSEV